MGQQTLAAANISWLKEEVCFLPMLSKAAAGLSFFASVGEIIHDGIPFRGEINRTQFPLTNPKGNLSLCLEERKGKAENRKVGQASQ